MFVVASWQGLAVTDVKHFGTPRNSVVEGDSEVTIPLPTGPAQRRSAIVVPQTTNVEYSGGGYFTPSYIGGVVPDMYFIGSGDVTVDLRDYYDDVKKSGNEDIYLFAGSSDVTILLPKDESLVIDSTVGRGDVVLDNGTTTRVLDNDYVQRAPAWVDPEMQLEVHLFIGEGSVTIAEDAE